MATRAYVTTNDTIRECLEILDELIGWAREDAQHAEENDAPDTAADDRHRALTLARARILVESCKR